MLMVQKYLTEISVRGFSMEIMACHCKHAVVPCVVVVDQAGNLCKSSASANA
jgi:hypothetical protein